MRNSVLLMENLGMLLLSHDTDWLKLRRMTSAEFNEHLVELRCCCIRNEPLSLLFLEEFYLPNGCEGVNVGSSSLREILRIVKNHEVR